MLQTSAATLGGPLGQHLTREGTPLSLVAYFTLEGQAAIWRTLASTGGSCTPEGRQGGGRCGASPMSGALAVGDTLSTEQREVGTTLCARISILMYIYFVFNAG